VTGERPSSDRRSWAERDPGREAGQALGAFPGAAGAAGPPAERPAELLDSEFYGPGENPRFNRTLVQATAEQTVAWLAGEALPDSAWVDPAMRRRMRAQRDEINGVIDECVQGGIDPRTRDGWVEFCNRLVPALWRHSAETSRRLAALNVQALAGDAEAAHLQHVMVAELVRFAGQAG
jgi:hypothetical protein